MIRAGARGVSILGRLGLSETRMSKAEFGPFKWYLKYKDSGEPLERPVLLLSWLERTKYVLNEEALKVAAPDVDYKAAVAQLAE